MKVAVRPRASLLDDFDREFGAVGLGEIGLVLKAFRHTAFAVLMRIAVFVEVEQFGREGLAARVSLAPVLVDVNLQLSGHGRFPLPRAASMPVARCADWRFLCFSADAACFGHVSN